MKIGNIVLPQLPKGTRAGRDYLSVSQLAERWECTIETVHKAIKNGLPAVARDGVAYVPRAEVVWHETSGSVAGRSGSGGGASRSSGTTRKARGTDAPFGQIVEITLTLKRRDGSAITSKYVRDPGT